MDTSSSISAARKLSSTWKGPVAIARILPARNRSAFTASSRAAARAIFVLTGLFARSLHCRFHLRFLLFGLLPVAFPLRSVRRWRYAAADMNLVAASAGTGTREISNGSQSVAVNSFRSWPFGVVSTFL